MGPAIKSSASSSSLLLSSSSFSSTTTTRKTADGTDDDQSNNATNMNQYKERLARAALKQVAIYGWTNEAITMAAAQDPKLSLGMAGMISSPIELLHWFMDDMNRQLRVKRQQQQQLKIDNFHDATTTSSTTTTTDIIFDSIQWRLQQVIPLVECGQWHKGMALGLTSPLVTQQQLHDLIEIVSPDDASLGYQAALGGIFAATELHLLTDTSVEYQDTWAFLRRALNEVEQYQDQMHQLPVSPFLSTIFSIPKSSFKTNTVDTSIPLMASMAVASSLLDGVTSLILPNGRSNGRSNGEIFAVPGTKASDYYSSSRSRRK
jgi:ubiquinone biosynthesis protein COQ9